MMDLSCTQKSTKETDNKKISNHFLTKSGQFHFWIKTHNSAESNIFLSYQAFYCAREGCNLG